MSASSSSSSNEPSSASDIRDVLSTINSDWNVEFVNPVAARTVSLHMSKMKYLIHLSMTIVPLS